jgi:hypothetical protein
MVYYSGATTDAYRKFSGSQTTHLIIFNDSTTNKLDISIDGQNKIGQINESEGIDFRDVNLDDIYIKSTSAGNSCNFRLWFFGSRKQLYQEFVEIEKAEIPVAFRQF